MNKAKLVATCILGISSIGAMGVAQAATEDLGCTFVLCMAAPNPLGIAECVSPVKKVLKSIAKGKKPPICKMEDGKPYKYDVTVINNVKKPPVTTQPKELPKDKPVLAPLGAGNNGVPIPSTTAYCPKGYIINNFGDDMIFHTGALPSGYNQFDYKELSYPTHPFSDFQIPMTNNHNVRTGEASDELSNHYTYSQRLCVSDRPKAIIKQASPDGKKVVLHAWVDKLLLLTGDDANKRMFVSGNIPNVLGKKPMLSELAGQIVTPERAEMVKQAREQYVSEYKHALNVWGYTLSSNGGAYPIGYAPEDTAGETEVSKYVVTMDGQTKTFNASSIN